MSMNVYWWQGGLHAEPETDAEREALMTLWNGVRRDEHAPANATEDGSISVGGTGVNGFDRLAVG